MLVKVPRTFVGLYLGFPDVNFQGELLLLFVGVPFIMALQTRSILGPRLVFTLCACNTEFVRICIYSYSYSHSHSHSRAVAVAIVIHTCM